MNGEVRFTITDDEGEEKEIKVPLGFILPHLLNYFFHL